MRPRAGLIASSQISSPTPVAPRYTSAPPSALAIAGQLAHVAVEEIERDVEIGRTLVEPHELQHIGRRVLRSGRIAVRHALAIGPLELAVVDGALPGGGKRRGRRARASARTKRRLKASLSAGAPRRPRPPPCI